MFSDACRCLRQLRTLYYNVPGAFLSTSKSHPLPNILAFCKEIIPLFLIFCYIFILYNFLYFFTGFPHKLWINLWNLCITWGQPVAILWKGLFPIRETANGPPGATAEVPAGSAKKGMLCCPAGSGNKGFFPSPAASRSHGAPRHSQCPDGGNRASLPECHKYPLRGSR